MSINKTVLTHKRCRKRTMDYRYIKSTVLIVIATWILTPITTINAKHIYSSNAYNVENEYCPHTQFIKELTENIDENGALLYYDRIVPTLDKSSMPMSISNKSNANYIYPCYNRAYTSDAEQWDGLKDTKNVKKLKKLNQKCYFSVGICNKYEDDTNTDDKTFFYSSNDKFKREDSQQQERIQIFIPSDVPYVKKLFSTEQIGQCKTKCEYIYPTMNEYNYNDEKQLELKSNTWKRVVEKYDGVLFPFDWSYGSMSAMVPSSSSSSSSDDHIYKLKEHFNQIWVAFSEEDVLDPSAGRPKLWSNTKLIDQMDLISTYDYAMSDVPFNLYKYHFWGPCTVNMYFRYISFKQFDSNVPLISYASRNCRKNRDELVKNVMKYTEVAAIGKCLNNSPWPFEKASYPYWQEKIIALQKYKFTLAFQGYGNGGLISEKLYDAFAAGTVPIFYGVSRVVVESFAPSPYSFLHVDDFQNIQDLTAYVKEAGTNEEMYNKFHQWRENGVNKQFCNLLKTNINSIACRMCEKVREKKVSKTKAVGGAVGDNEADIYAIKDSTIILVIVIRSTNTELGKIRRDAIRKTWGQDIKNHPHVRLFFLVSSNNIGASNNNNNNNNIDAEDDLYKDLLITPSSNNYIFNDNAKNDSSINFRTMNDTIWFMQEITTRIDDFWYVYVGYDNVYLNALRLVNEMSKQVRLFSFYVGTVNEAITGETVMTNRDIVSKNEYPLNTLPPYALDTHYMLSIDNIRFIVGNVQNLRSLPLEDEGITLTLWLLGLQVHPENHVMFQSYRKCTQNVVDGGHTDGVLSLSNIPNVPTMYDIHNQAKDQLGYVCEK